MFGGFFGGGSSSSSSSSSSPTNTPSSSSSSSPSNDYSTINITNSTSLPSSLSRTSNSNSNSSPEIRARIEQTVTTQSNVANAKYLISKINENCFDHCITAPGSSLSSKEQGCMSGCIQKYIQAWNTTSRAYIARLQREGAQLQNVAGAGGMGAAPAGNGKELF